MANRVTDYAFQRGNPLIDDATSVANGQQRQADLYGDQAGAYYQKLINEGGYTPEEAQKILGQGANGNIPGLDDLATMSPEDQQALQLTDQEKQGITGNPYSPMNYLHSDTIGQYMTEGGQAQDAAVDQQRADFQGAIDPSKLGLSSRYGSDVNGAVSGTEGKLNDITGSDALNLSDDFNQKYEMTPDQQRDIVNAASRDVGAVSQGNFDAAKRQMDAAGVGPMGLASLRQRMSRDASSDAAAAATKARIAASDEAAGRVANAEQMRLNAGQTKAGMQADAAKYSGDQKVNALNDIESKRMAGEQDISNRQMQAATTTGNNQLENKENQTAAKVGAVENVADREVAAAQTADQQASQRAGQIASTDQAARSKVVDDKYNRGANANQAASQRSQQIADTRNTQQNQGGQGLTSQQQIRSQNANTARGQAVDAFGNTGNIANNAQAQPGTASKVIGGILGGVGAVASAFRYGGVATEPTSAVLGEDGPEAVIPLGPQSAAPQQPQAQPAWKSNLSKIGQVASGVSAGMNPSATPMPRYGQQPQAAPTADPNQRPVPAWKSNLQKIGQVAQGINAGMNGQPLPRYGQPQRARGAGATPPPTPMTPTPPPSANVVTQPTRAILGTNGPEAVVPLKQRQQGAMRMPPSVLSNRYAFAG